MTTKKRAATLAVCAAALAVCAADEFSYWNPSGSGNWSETTRWMAGNKTPDQTRNVSYANVDAWATDADYDILLSLVRLRYHGTTSLDLRFDQDHDDFCVNTIMADGYGGTCTLVKSGKGRLVHTSGGYGFTPDRFIVTNGVLTLKYVNKDVAYGVYGGSTLAFDTQPYPVVGRLDGDGFVTNLQWGTQLYFEPSASGLPGVFSGTLAANLDPTFYTGCVQYFTQTHYPRDLTVRFMGGTVGLTCFGQKGVSGSLGPGKRLGNFNGGSSTIVYLGAGETCDKQLAFNENVRSAAIDAGGGGLELSGDWDLRSDPRILPVAFMGTNAVRSIVSGSFAANASNALAVVKRGSGTWRFAGLRTGCGSVSIEDGALECAVLYERGFQSSLGTADNCREAIDDLRDNLPAIPWVQRLGTHSTTGAFVYVGADEAELLTRPFAVCGTGRIANATPSVSLNLRGVFAADAAGGTLVLDGAGLYDHLSDVTNGPGPLAVEKVGTGTWTLGGNVALAGGVTVKEGTLRISAVPADVSYSWYRFTARQLWTTDQAGGIQLSQFGLFAADGTQQNLNPVEPAEARGRSYTLAAGACAWNHPVVVGGGGTRPLTKLFLGEEGLMNVNRTTASGATCANPQSGDPRYWISFTQRLADGVKPVAFYDVQSQQGWQSGTMYVREPRHWTLEASVDGRTWDLLDERKECKVTKSGRVWYSSDSKTFDAAKPGFAIATKPAATKVALGPVAVAAGATLAADGDVELSAIRADAVSGGTLDGFSFAAAGTLDVAGYEDAALTLPVTFANAKNLANLKRWTVRQNGKALRVQMRVAGGTVTLAPLGSVLLVR